MTVPPLRLVRPTSDRVREAVFDALGSVEGDRVLDVFAGSGALGLEALSRGAARCTFIEKDARVSSVLALNIARLGFEEMSEILTVSHTTGLRLVEARGERYDVVFLDPPYRRIEEVMAEVGPRLDALLAVEGVAVVEGPKGAAFQVALERCFERSYGDTSISMFARKVDG